MDLSEDDDGDDADHGGEADVDLRGGAASRSAVLARVASARTDGFLLGMVGSSVLSIEALRGLILR